MPNSLQYSLSNDTERFLQTTVAVIPAWNEEDTIGSVVVTARQFADRVIVVDDGSTDRTAEIAELAGAELISLDRNHGKARAVMTGLAYARSLSPRAVVLLDGDGQHNPCEIPIVTRPVIEGKADLVIGSRFLGAGHTVPSYRRVGQKTLDFVTNIGSPVKTTDSQSGFRALSPRALVHLDFASEGYNIESDMFYHFSSHGLAITEVPITVKYEVNHSHKKDPLSHGVDVLGHIVGLIGYRRPLLTFGLPGFVLTLIGIGASLYALTELVVGSKFHSVVFIGGITSLILGLLLVMTSLILNSLIQIVKMER